MPPTSHRLALRVRFMTAAIRVGSLVVGLVAFVGALQLLKTAASSLRAPAFGHPRRERRDDPGPRLARRRLLVLSGSPVAATAMSLVAAGEAKETVAAEHFTELQGFTMLTGSRLGPRSSCS